MDIIEVSRMIQEKIKLLEQGRAGLEKLARDKARALAEYERDLGVITLQLKNGVDLEFDGQKTGKLPTTSIERIARGMCWKSKLASEEAEALYKAHIVKMEAVEAELNGLQSINRFLQNT